MWALDPRSFSTPRLQELQPGAALSACAQSGPAPLRNGEHRYRVPAIKVTNDREKRRSTKNFRKQLLKSKRSALSKTPMSQLPEFP